jgi:glutaredoxin
VKVLTLYTKPDCHLCEEALRILREILTELRAETGTDQGDTRSARIPESASAEGACLPASVELHVCDITTEEDLHRAYFERIPVVALDGEELFEYFVDEAALRERLESRR